jgi:2-dehydropantoate 2-reductase
MGQGGAHVSVAIIGTGAVAGLCVSWLDLAGAGPVAVCGRSPLEQFTITGDGVGGTDVRTIAVLPAPDGPVDWVLVTVKAQDTASTAPWLDRLVGPGTVVVVLQNGVDHVQRVQPLVGEAEVLPVLVMAAAERTGPGAVTHRIGNLLVTARNPAAQRLSELFDGGATVHQDPDLLTAAWRKLLVNVGGNCITALTGRRAEVLRVPEVRELCRAVLTETAAAGRSVGALLTDADVEGTLRLYDSYPDDNGSSMYYDRMSGRPLEHELIPGAVVRAAERGGVDVPVTRAIWALTKAVSEAVPLGRGPILE